MNYSKLILALFALTVASCATNAKIQNITAENSEKSRDICGYSVVKNNDETWTIYKNGNEIEVLSSGFTIEQIREIYCT